WNTHGRWRSGGGRWAKRGRCQSRSCPWAKVCRISQTKPRATTTADLRKIWGKSQSTFRTKYKQATPTVVERGRLTVAALFVFSDHRSCGCPEKILRRFACAVEPWSFRLRFLHRLHDNSLQTRNGTLD